MNGHNMRACATLDNGQYLWFPGSVNDLANTCMSRCIDSSILFGEYKSSKHSLQNTALHISPTTFIVHQVLPTMNRTPNASHFKFLSSIPFSCAE